MPKTPLNEAIKTMGTKDVVEYLKHVSNADRLAVIEAATRLIREDLSSEGANSAGEDPILQVAGCLSGEPLTAVEIEKQLYAEE
jgi:hypothetical protein